MKYKLMLPALLLIVSIGCKTGTEIVLLRDEVSALKKTISDLQKEKKFSILFLGDILLVNHSKKLMKAKGITYPFQKIKEDLKNYDYVIANLETPISKRGIPVRNRHYLFQLHPALAKCLNTFNLTGVTLANNHVFDFGPDGLLDTMKYLKKWKIAYSGAGKTLKDARKPIVLIAGSTTVYIFSYCERPPDKYYATNDNPGTAPLDLKQVMEDVETYKKRDNIVLVTLHWGIEQTHMPRKEQIYLAHEIIDAGADGIIGHHPHWPQGIEMYKNRPIVYSLGNFVNGHYNKIEKDNMMVALYFKESKLETVEIMMIAGKNKETKFQPYVMKGPEAKKSLTMIRYLSRMLKTDFDIFGYKGIINFDK